MSVSSTFLRVVLILALALNGVTSALAATEMSAHHQGEEMVGPPAAMAMADCPDHHAASEATTVPDEGISDGADCCKSSACGCACSHLPCSAVGAAVVALTLVRAEGVVPRLALGHATPALPHLIRPPIG